MNRDPLNSKTIVLGVTGSIACYKAVELARRLTQAGANVEVILTTSAQKFITPLTFETLTQRLVVTEMWKLLEGGQEGHVALADRADAILIAPATATTLARIAHGFSDDMLSLTVLASRAPLLLAPAMRPQMWNATATQQNLATLIQRGAFLIEPEEGQLAQQALGRGRLADTPVILGRLRCVLSETGDLAGRQIVVTAGGTQEPIDPVRYITNRSSGKMGYALAEAARDRGAQVTLLATDAVQLPTPTGVHLVRVQTALELLEAVQRESAQAAVLIMAAAVADYRVENPSAHKIKKQSNGNAQHSAGDELLLRLVPNPDILASVDYTGLIKVGFAAETNDLLENARAKLQRKNLSLIVANDVTASDSGFGADTNTVTLIGRDGAAMPLPNLPKYEVAHAILDRVHSLLEHADLQTPMELRQK